MIAIVNFRHVKVYWPNWTPAGYIRLFYSPTPATSAIMDIKIGRVYKVTATGKAQWIAELPCGKVMRHKTRKEGRLWIESCYGIRRVPSAAVIAPGPNARMEAEFL